MQGDEDAVVQATAVLEELRAMVAPQRPLDSDQVRRSSTASPATARKPYAPSQSRRAARFAPALGPGRLREGHPHHDLVFCVGPAGTGKTYLAVATAVEALRDQTMRKIVLVRPAVEAGESLGFLPGDLQAKINPYLRPLLDALREMMDHEQVQPLHGRRRDRSGAAGLHARPHAQQRVHHHGRGAEHDRRADEDVSHADGRGLEDRRLGRHHADRSAARTRKSGLIDALSATARISRLPTTSCREAIVRHRLVQDIVRAYEEGSKKKR